MNNLKLAVDAYVRLHTLICENKGESEESDKIRDEMDVYYESLSEDDQEWLGKLSANLYVLSSTASTEQKKEIFLFLQQFLTK